MIVCACIKIVPHANPKDVMYVCGVRHGDCFTTMTKMNLPPRTERDEVQGFMTHKNEFLDRSDAYNHAAECGQVAPTVREYKFENCEVELYSEDLW